MNASKSAIILAAALILSIPAAGFAGPHHEKGPSRAEHKLTPEQRKAFRELRTEHAKVMEGLVAKVQAKTFEIKALAPNPNMKPEDIRALIAEREQLLADMKTARADFRQKCEKAGLPAPRHGFGPGPRAGHGAPKGPGMPCGCPVPPRPFAD